MDMLPVNQREIKPSEFRVTPVIRVDNEGLRNDLNHRENYDNKKPYIGGKIDIQA